jgi:hypothetical protein
MNDINPLDLQRLVDGECDDAEIRSLLTDAESNPENWRAMASAFVEDQVWQKQFRSDGTPSVKGKTPTDSGPSHSNTQRPAMDNSIAATEISQKVSTKDDQTTDHQNDYVDDNLSHRMNARPGSRRRSSSNLYNWLAVAAGLAIAGMVGYIAGSDRPAIPDFVPVASVPQASPLGAAENSIAAVPTPSPEMTPAYHLQLPEGEANQAGLAGEVPLFLIQSREELAQFKQPKWQHIQMPPHLLKQLKVKGFQMNQNVDFVSGKHSDGRAFVVPVRTINFTPGQ